MSDTICKKTMQRCQTPGMCSPHGGCRPPEPLYATVDRDELKRLQADSARLDFMLREQCVMWSMNGSSLPKVHALSWPNEGTSQSEWYPTEREAIDAAMGSKSHE